MLRELLIAFVIVGICMVIQISGMALLADWLFGVKTRTDRNASTAHDIGLLMVVFTIIVCLHVIDASIWAGFYVWRGLFPDFETSIYFSLVSYATLGYGDVVLPKAWRLLGTIEGISGVLLFGLSTAFLFAIVNIMIQRRLQRQGKYSTDNTEQPIPTLDSE